MKKKMYKQTFHEENAVHVLSELCNGSKEQ